MLSHKNFLHHFWVICFFLPVLLLTACSPDSFSSSPAVTPRPTRVSTPEEISPGSTAACPKAAVGPNVQGIATNAELSAVIESTTGFPILVRHDVKIRWTMTGSGALHVVALGPSGMRVHPLQGPSEHRSPTEEWGSLFNFPVAGCWDLHASRGNGFGDIWLAVQ